VLDLTVYKENCGGALIGKLAARELFSITLTRAKNSSENLGAYLKAKGLL